MEREQCKNKNARPKLPFDVMGKIERKKLYVQTEWWM
jgi:hypothetical protein